jgi:hypothetical protein
VCVLPCPPRVGFGDTFVDAIEVSPTQLNVTTPPHAPGVVDLTIVIPGRSSLVVDDGFTFEQTTEGSYERVLLPIYFKDVVPGAYGAQWATDLWMHNGTAFSVAIANRVCPDDTPCPPVFPLAEYLEPFKSLHNPAQFFSPTRSNPSLLLYVSTPAGQSLGMGLRVADTSRNALNAGADLPLVRDKDLLTGVTNLLNVPLDNQKFRLLLRVYDVIHDQAEFSVRFYAAGEDVQTQIYGVDLTATTPTRAPFRSEAAYAELDITQLLNLRLAWPQVARVEIVPLTAGSRYWGFISLTNNETQLVTLVTP